MLKSLKAPNENYNFNIDLHIAGYKENNLKKFISENNLSDQVTFLGNLKSEELISYYNACDFLCLPSYSEGFLMVIVESLLCGTSVVASNFGGIP